MKYWVYKDSRILGPFEKDAFAGMPGVDATTLVSVGDSAAAVEGGWKPLSAVEELSGIPIDRGPAWRPDSDFHTASLLDDLQIEAAGLIADDEFPGAAADLFEDADMKRTFGDLIAPRPPAADDGELRRARERAAELATQLEVLYKRVAELESGQTNLLHRLAEKEMLLRRQATPSSPAVEAFLRDVSVLPTPPAPPASTPAVPPMPAAFQSHSAGAAPATPTAPPDREPPPYVPPTEEAPPAAAPLSGLPALAPSSFVQPPPPPPLPEIPALNAPPASAAPAAAAPAPAPTEPPPLLPPSPATAPEKAGKPLFERKTFKIAPTVKTFRVVGEGQAESSVPSAAEASAAAPEAALPPAAAPAPAPEPIAAETPAPAPAPTTFDWGTTPPAPAATPAPGLPPITLNPQAAAPVETPTAPPPPPPATVQFEAPPRTAAPVEAMPAFAAAPPTPTDAPIAPPATGVFSSTGAPAVSDADGETAAVPSRLAKPAPKADTVPPVRPPRSNKGFLIGAGALVVVMAAVGAVFLRHPKDLKQMTDLDDGRARVGAEAVDDASRPPMVKPQPVAPAAPVAPQPSAADEAARAASQAKLDAAVAAVKDFPLDGGRGTVAQWLQYSYTANPGAGKESWTASETADKTFLVEYRFTPAAAGAAEAHYLFEADMDRGFVIGKNAESKSMLAGGPRGSEGGTKGSASKEDLDAAIRAVKDFPLDGSRGTVSKAIARAGGKPSCTASEIGDKTFLVECRGGRRRYSFEADMDPGFVIGKNLDAKSLLAGRPLPAAPAARKAPPRSSSSRRKTFAPRASHRVITDSTPPDLPQLPLPDSGDLRPPSENDGAFTPETQAPGSGL